MVFPPKRKALLVAFAVEIGLLLVGFLLYMWLGSALADGLVSTDVAFQLIVAMLIVVLVAPAFIAGYLANERGFMYGLLLGLLPTGMSAFSSAGGPLIFMFVYLLIAGLSGVGGQSFAHRRHEA